MKLVPFRAPAPARDPRIAQLLNWAEGKWGPGALVRWGDAFHAARVDAIPTGFSDLDGALGIGGLPLGRITEVSGPDSTGRQSLAAELIVQCQKQEGVALYLDMAGRLDPDQMASLGVDPAALLVARPKELSQGLEMAIRLARGGGIRLIVCDLSGSDASGTSPALHSSLSLALRRLVAAVDHNAIAFLFLTDAGPRSPRARGSFGRQALRYFASVRLEMERREWVRRGRDVIGCRSLVKVVKNKLAPPLGEAEVELIFHRFPPQMPVLQSRGAGKATPMPVGGRRFLQPIGPLACSGGPGCHLFAGRSL